MKVPVNWLQEYISPKLNTRDLAEALEQAGIEVEGIDYAPELDAKIITAKVLSVRKHPGADRLRLVSVDTGRGQLDVVCGAPNVAKGQTVALAQVGAVLPDGTTIEKAEIRGKQSEGMISSAKELGLGDDHSGILVLPAGLPLGQPVGKHVVAGDVLDVKTAANRSDLVGIIGLAREAMANYGGKLKLPDTAELKLQSDARVEIQSPNVSRYMLAELKIRPGQSSPAWLAAQLQAAGIRPINLVVDVTNYVMLEWGQPLHAFNAAKIKLPVLVRQAEKVEKFTTLDGVKRSLFADDLIIADSRGVLALAGVMGGQKAEVTDKTERIYLESAAFNGGSVRKTAVRHNLRTDASGRYERQLPVQLPAIAVARAIELLERLGGAKLVGQICDHLAVWPWITHIGLEVNKFERLTGLKMKPATAVTKLQALGFAVELFDIAAEAKKHAGKPYKFGAKFKTDAETAFDCSYLTDRLYSRIGVWIGHTAHQQYKNGQSVEISDLQPGDLLFRDGPWEKLDPKEREGVSHVAIYVGGGRIVHAKNIERSASGEWIDIANPSVVIDPLEHLTEDPQYLGARRYVANLDGWLAVTVPWWRPDVRLAEDLVEELVRQVGYAQIPATLPAIKSTDFTPDKHWSNLWKTKSILKAVGVFEVNTYSFVSGRDLENWDYQTSAHLKLRNPKSSEQAYLRRNLLPSLINAAAANRHYAKKFGLYEVSKVFWPAGKGKLPAEPLRLGVLMCSPANSYLEVKRVIDTLAKGLGVSLEVHEATYPELTAGRAVKITAGGQAIGIAGEIKPANLAKAKLGGQAAYLELDLAGLLSSIHPPKYQEISKYPPVSRDLSFEINQGITWAKISQALKEYNPQFLSDYAGAGVKPGHKKVALRFEFRATDRTLTDAEALQQLARVKKLLETKFNTTTD